MLMNIKKKHFVIHTPWAVFKNQILSVSRQESLFQIVNFCIRV